MIAAPVLAPRASQPIGRCPEQTCGTRHVHPNLGYYNSIWVTGCSPGGTGEVRLVERDNESNVIARATIVVVQYTVPSHIRNLRQTEEGDGSLTVTWDAPRRTGGSDIVGYGVQHRLDGADWASESPPVRDTSGTGTSHTVTGLTNGSKYHIRVTPCNRESGCLHWSERMGFSHASVSGCPQAPPPPPPVNKLDPVRDLTLTPGDHKLGVRWQAPLDDGGRAISRYQVQYKLATVTAWISNPEVTDGTTATTVPILTGDDRMPLTNGVAYHVHVRACNGSSDNDCGDWEQGLGTPEVPRPRNLDVVPRAGRKAVLTWDLVAGAARYQVQAQILGQADWHDARCEAATNGQPTQPKCVIDLEYIAEPGGNLAGLHTHKAFALQVRALRPQTSLYSEPVVIIDTPIFRAKGASTRVEVSWRPVGAHSHINADGRYQLRYRRFRGEHTSVDWNPETLRFHPTRPTSLLPVGTTSHPIGSLVNYELYAIQLLYNAPRSNAAPIPVYAARDAYAWPSDRAAGAGKDEDGNFYAGERVGTFPLWPTATKTTYAYHICSDTFPTTGGAPVRPDELEEEDILRIKARSFIQHALGQWEAATSTGPVTSLIAMNYLGTKYANYDELINPIVDAINAGYSSDLSNQKIREHVQNVLKSFNLAELTEQDRKLNEVIYVDVPEDQESEVYFSEVSKEIGLDPCGLEPLACAPRTEDVDTTDILLYGGSFAPEFTWDIPTTFGFSQCSGADRPSPSLYATVVHEGGHVLGIIGTTRSGGVGDQPHHSQVEDSVIKTGGADACTPTPFDVMAIYALYQSAD